jgi:putative flippase GtrA
MSVPRESMLRLVHRWLKFNAVGALGICVQVLAVCFLDSALEINSLLATALAVEAAVLHNFFWHQHFTWGDRRAGAAGNCLRRLLGFNATTGAVSIAGNLFFVSLLLHEFHAPLLVANLLAVAACSLVTFTVSDKMIFRVP